MSHVLCALCALHCVPGQIVRRKVRETRLALQLELMLRAAEGVRVGARAADEAVAVAVAAVPCGRRVDNFFAVVADADAAAAAAAAVAVFSSTCLSVVGFSCCKMLNFFSIFSVFSFL